LTGKKFNRLKVIKYYGNNKRGDAKWECLCDCHKKVVVLGKNLRSKRTQSCGCLQKEINIKRLTIHSHSKKNKHSKTYICWENMIQRCNNPSHPRYKDWGGRGITVCKRWLKFENFLADVGEIPKGLTLDRINNNKGYSPKNCRLSVTKEQLRNKRNNINIPYNGKMWCLADLAKANNIHKDTLRLRLNKGMSIEEALTTPTKK